MAFYVGQKVVCISVDPTPEIAKFCRKFTKVRVGGLYTTREIDTRAVNIHGCACLRFVGISGVQEQTSVGLWEQNASYPATHFRPVTERKTDISIFKAMLNPKEIERQKELIGQQLPCSR